jgi:ubiquinone/menaquinone biosynthesis C-methylase UbiE
MAAPGDRRHPPAQTLVEYFDHRAGGYDRQLWMERWALATAARLARPAAGARVVDLATGTGALAAAILDRQPRIGGLVAVDAAPHMLERAARRLGVPNPRVRLVTADVRGVPLPDGAADLVSVGYLLHLLSPPVRGEVLAEARRLLRPGGRLVVVVHGSPRGVPGRAYRATWRALSRMVPGGIVGEGPIEDLVPIVAGARFEVDATWRIPGLYWSQVLSARRPTGG